MKHVYQAVCLSMLIAFLSACDDDTIALPDITVSFSNSNTSLSEDDNTLDVQLIFSRALTEASEIIIDVTEGNLVYGDDYTSSPAVSDGRITLSVPANITSTTFTLTKKKELILTVMNHCNLILRHYPQVYLLVETQN